MKIERIDQLYQYLRVENILPQPFDAEQRRRFEEAIESFADTKVKNVSSNSCVQSSLPRNKTKGSKFIKSLNQKQMAHPKKKSEKEKQAAMRHWIGKKVSVTLRGYPHTGKVVLVGWDYINDRPGRITLDTGKDISLLVFASADGKIL